MIGLPLNFFMLPAVAGPKAAVAATVKPHIPIDRTMILLAFAFAAAWTVTGAMAAHLPRILEAAGATPVQAVTAGTLIGPAQVAARILEASSLAAIIRCFRHGSLASRIRSALLSSASSAAARPAVRVFHGAGNGILTIARGTLPLAISVRRTTPIASASSERRRAWRRPWRRWHSAC